MIVVHEKALDKKEIVDIRRYKKKKKEREAKKKKRRNRKKSKKTQFSASLILRSEQPLIKMSFPPIYCLTVCCQLIKTHVTGTTTTVQFAVVSRKKKDQVDLVTHLNYIPLLQKFSPSREVCWDNTPFCGWKVVSEMMTKS